MAAAARSFGSEREAEPVKEARVVGSELVDTYTVCRGRGRQNWGWRLEPGVPSREGARGDLGPATGEDGVAGGLGFEEGNLGKAYGVSQVREQGPGVGPREAAWGRGGVRFQK